MNPALLFWLAAFALVAFTLVALAWPLLRGRTSDSGPAEAAASTAIYRDQRRQLDADLAAGAITKEEHAAAKDELVSRLSAEMAMPASGPAASPSRTPWIAAMALIAVIPAAAVLVYHLLGNPAALTSAPQPRFSEHDVLAMVETLAQRMKANPSDPKGWLLLARSYASLGRFEDSANAYAQAAQRMAPNADLYADWADTLAMTQNQKLAGKPEELVMRALVLDPNHPKALALAATASMEHGDYDAALSRWRELKSQVTPGSADDRAIDETIAEIVAKQGAGGALAKGANPHEVGDKAPWSADASKSTVAAAPSGKSPSEASTGGALTGRVELDPKLAPKVAPDDTVFIYARATEGPRMPLAVVRLKVRDLPAAFRLDDSMSMTPELKLSKATHVIVEARVSKSGNAVSRSGDLRGVSAPLKPGEGDIRVVIADVVP